LQDNLKSSNYTTFQADLWVDPLIALIFQPALLFYHSFTPVTAHRSRKIAAPGASKRTGCDDKPEGTGARPSAKHRPQAFGMRSYCWDHFTLSRLVVATGPSDTATVRWERHDASSRP